jgi:hypothetical protein
VLDDVMALGGGGGAAAALVQAILTERELGAVGLAKLAPGAGVVQVLVR